MRSDVQVRAGQGFIAGSLIGSLGGLIGLGGAEFRLPVLVGLFRLPTMLVGFARYSRSGAFAVLRTERRLFVWMLLGSILGSALLGAVPSNLPMAVLGLVLPISAVKTFQHTH